MFLIPWLPWFDFGLSIEGPPVGSLVSRVMLLGTGRTFKRWGLVRGLHALEENYRILAPFSAR